MKQLSQWRREGKLQGGAISSLAPPFAKLARFVQMKIPTFNGTTRPSLQRTLFCSEQKKRRDEVSQNREARRVVATAVNGSLEDEGRSTRTQSQRKNTQLVVRRWWQKPPEDADDRRTADRRMTKPADARLSEEQPPGQATEAKTTAETNRSGSNETAAELNRCDDGDRRRRNRKKRRSRELVRRTRRELRTEPGGSGGGNSPPISPTKSDEAGL